jgi:hypothetical protein
MPANKHKRNSDYTVATRFHLFTGDSPVILLDFFGFHNVSGCICLNRAPQFRINHSEVEISSDYKSLVPPVTVPAHSAVLVDYARRVAPPLTVMPAADCDYGDFEVRVRYRIGASTAELSSWFELLPSGGMKPIAHRRDVRVLNDGHLKQLRDEGRLSPDNYESLMGFDGETRYRVAFSDNLTRNYLEVPDWLRDVLRALVHEPSLENLRKRFERGDT